MAVMGMTIMAIMVFPHRGINNPDKVCWSRYLNISYHPTSILCFLSDSLIQEVKKSSKYHRSQLELFNCIRFKN